MRPYKKDNDCKDNTLASSASLSPSPKSKHQLLPRDSSAFQKINRTVGGITVDQTLDGIKKFIKEFKGKLALQVMFLQENKEKGKEMAALAAAIKPDEVQINTPLRSCPAKPLSEKEIDLIKGEFKNLNAVSVYDAEKPVTRALDLQETLQRRPLEGKLND